MRFVIMLLVATTGWPIVTLAHEKKAKNDKTSWVLKSLQFDGVMLEEKDLKQERMKGVLILYKKHPAKDCIKIYRRDVISEEATVSIDSTKNPKHFDLTTIAPDTGKRESMAGIYKVNNNRLIVCSAKPGGDRPKNFNAGNDVTLYAFQRAAKAKQNNK